MVESKTKQKDISENVGMPILKHIGHIRHQDKVYYQGLRRTFHSKKNSIHQEDLQIKRYKIP